MSSFLFNIIVLEWLEINGSKMWEWQSFISFTISDSKWFQIISIVIHIGAILDFQKITSTSKKHDKLMPWSAAIFKKNAFIIKRVIFPVKSKLQKPFWSQGYEITLEKVNSFILEQIRIIEFCPLALNFALNYDVLITSGTRGIGIW